MSAALSAGCAGPGIRCASFGLLRWLVGEHPEREHGGDNHFAIGENVVQDVDVERGHGARSAADDAVIAAADGDEAAVARDHRVDVELGFDRAVDLAAFGLLQAPARGLVEIAHGGAVVVVLRGAVGVEQLQQQRGHAALLHAGLGVV